MRLLDAGRVFFNDDVPAAGGQAYFYSNNTTTLKAVYTDSGLTVASPNPITLDSEGRLPNEVFGIGQYTVRVVDSNNALAWTEDDIGEDNSSGPDSIFNYVSVPQYIDIVTRTGSVGMSDAATSAIAATEVSGRALYYPAGLYNWDAQQTLDGSKEHNWFGDGAQATVLKTSDTSGPSTAMIFCDDDTNAGTRQLRMRGMTLKGNLSRTDPVGIWMQSPKQCEFYDVEVQEMGNTGVFFTAPNNVGLRGVSITSCGPRYGMAKSVSSTTVSITASDQTLTSNSAIFAAGDAGKAVYVAGAGTGGEILATTIASFTSTTEVELTDAAGTTVADAVWSYGGLKGSITASDATLAVTSDETVFDSTSVGMYVYVLGAGDTLGDMVHISKVLSVTDGQTVELEDNADVTVSDVDVYLGGGFVSCNPADYGGTRQTNDLVLSDVQNDLFGGFGYMIGTGVNVFTYSAKSHGIHLTSSDFASMSGHNWVVDNNRWTSITGELDYGNVYGSGHIYVTGHRVNGQVDNFQIDRAAPNLPIVDFGSTSVRSDWNVGSGLFNGRIDGYTPAVYRTGAEYSQVKSTGVIQIANSADERPMPATPVRGLYVDDSKTIADDASTTINIPFRATRGTLIVWSDRATVCGTIAYRTSSDPSGVSSTLIAGGGDLEVTTGDLAGTTGTDVKFTISPGTSDNTIHLENRMGGNTTLEYMFLGRPLGTA